MNDLAMRMKIVQVLETHQYVAMLKIWGVLVIPRQWGHIDQDPIATLHDTSLIHVVIWGDA